MKKWLNVEFESSSSTTQQFKNFVKDFKKAVTKSLGSEYSVKLSMGHFYVSGFIQKDGKYVYVSISDVRSWKNEWNTNILFRTAKSDTDFTGGMNNYSSLDNLKQSVDRLLR